MLKCVHLNFSPPFTTSLLPARAALPLSPSSSTFRARRCKNLQGLFQLMWFLLHVRLVRFNEGVCPEHIVLYMVHLVGLLFWHGVQRRRLWKVTFINDGDGDFCVCVFSVKMSHLFIKSKLNQPAKHHNSLVNYNRERLIQVCLSLGPLNTMYALLIPWGISDASVPDGNGKCHSWMKWLFMNWHKTPGRNNKHYTFII